jgi:O-antigen/teichoic acid export membrane protein
MAEEGTSARVARNTLANGAGMFAGVAISLVLTPFLINGLGLEEFGVWALALSISVLGGYASMADLGIETAAARYIAEARADADTQGAREVASTTMAFFAIVAVVVAPLLAVAAFPLVDLFAIPDDLRKPATLAFVLVASQLLIELPARVFFAALEGAQRYDVYQALEVLRAVVQAILFVLVLILDLGVAGLAAAMPVSSVVVLVAAWAMARRSVPELQVSVTHVSKARFKALVSFGGQYFFVRLMGTVYRQIDKAIIGVALDIRFVTIYEVANRLQQAASMVQSVAASALLPATAYWSTQRELLRDLYLRGTSIAVGISLPVVVAGFVFAEPLITTWIGDSVGESVGSARLFLTFVAFVSVHAVGTAMITALGQMRFMITLITIFTVVNLVVSIALVGRLGVDGVILGTVIAQAVIWMPYTLRFFRTFDVGVREWLVRVVLANLPGLVIQVLVALPLLAAAQRANNLAVVAALALITVLLSLATFVTIGLRPGDRASLKAALRGAVSSPARSEQ